MRKLALAIVASLIVVSGLFLATPRAAKAVCTIGLGCNCPQAAKGPFNDGLYYGLARTGLGSGTLTYELNADFFADKYQQGYCDIVTWVTWVDNNGDELNNTLSYTHTEFEEGSMPVWYDNLNGLFQPNQNYESSGTEQSYNNGPTSIQPAAEGFWMSDPSTGSNWICLTSGCGYVILPYAWLNVTGT